MRILALYPFLPYPVVSGAAQRGAYVLDILAPEHQVTLAAFIGRDDAPAELPAWKTYSLLACAPLLVTRGLDEPLTPAATRLRALRPNFRLTVPQSLNFFDSRAMWNRLAALDLTQFDALHVRFLGMSPYALALKRAAPYLHLVIDLDDNPSLLLFRKLSREKPRLGPLAWHVKELARTIAYELRELGRFDSVWMCSRLDARRLGRRLGASRMLVVENIVDAQRLAALPRHAESPAVLMIGDFNYGPNREGAEFFVQMAWPAIRARIPDAQLWLVGKNNQQDLLAWNGKDGITVTGLVDDVKTWLGRATVSIAPLFVGSGTKLKILEALGAGLPVVTTSIGAEGIDATSGADILIGDTPEAFAAHCIRILSDPTFARQLAEAGQRLVREKYDIPVMARAVLACYRLLAAPTHDQTRAAP